jgi:ferric-dicitrate binding protein FerR (iron transport regulator)
VGYWERMSSLKKAVARKAVKSTAKHTAHGTASKLKRSPIKAVTLLSVGAAAGLVAGWALGHNTPRTAGDSG